VDVDDEVVPADDLTVCIPKRVDTRFEPTVDAIETPGTHLEVERRTSRERTRDQLGNALTTPREEYRGVPLPFLQLVKGQPDVLQQSAISEFELTCRRSS